MGLAPAPCLLVKGRLKGSDKYINDNFGGSKSGTQAPSGWAGYLLEATTGLCGCSRQRDSSQSCLKGRDACKGRRSALITRGGCSARQGRWRGEIQSRGRSSSKGPVVKGTSDGFLAGWMRVGWDGTHAMAEKTPRAAGGSRMGPGFWGGEVAGVLRRASLVPGAVGRRGFLEPNGENRSGRIC